MTILKIIGIVLLCLIGLILLLMVLILAVPIRYRANAQKHPGQVPVADGGISWFIWLFAIKGELEGKKWRIYIKSLFWYLYDSSKPMEAKENRVARFILKKIGLYEDLDDSQTKKAQVGKSDSKEELDPKDEQNSKEELLDPIDETGLKDESTTGVDPESKNDANDQETAKISSEQDSTSRSTDPIEDLKEKLSKKYKKIQFQFTQICDRIKKVYKIVQEVVKTLEQDYTQRLLKALFAMLWSIFCYILPTKLEADVSFGIGDRPDTMGKVMAVLGCLYPLYGDHVKINPDFEGTYFEGSVKLKGRIRLGRILFEFIKLILNRDVLKLINMVLKNRRNG